MEIWLQRKEKMDIIDPYPNFELKDVLSLCWNIQWSAMVIDFMKS